MRPVLVVLVLALAAAGCAHEASRLDSGAAVVVSGRVLRADGSPASGVPVALLRDPSVGEVITGLLVIPLSLGTACLADPPAALCPGRSVKRATTTTDGGYSFNLTGADTQTAFGNARSFTLSTGVAGATVTADFKIQTENLRLPDFQAWQPAVTVAAGRIGWDPPAPGTYEVVFEDTAGQRVWTLESPRADVAFDPRILEDTAGRLAVAARSDTSAEGTAVSIRRQSEQVAYRSAAGAPLSRGRPCLIEPAGTSLSRCPLTDGDLATTLPRQPAPTTSTTASQGTTIAPVPSYVTIDLGRSVEVSLIVVRGCNCQVERSVDGRTWTAAGRASGFTALVPSRTGAARFVRLTGIYSEVREVSVWEGPAPAAGPPTTVPAGPPPAAAPGAPAAGPAPVGQPAGSRTVPALVALAALLAAAIATAGGALAGRRP